MMNKDQRGLGVHDITSGHRKRGGVSSINANFQNSIGMIDPNQAAGVKQGSINNWASLVKDEGFSLGGNYQEAPE
jgi:hypothetical protein